MQPRFGIVSQDSLMLQFKALDSWAFFGAKTLGRGAMVAQRTLDPFILVRIRAPQPDRPIWIVSVLDADSNRLI